jgi:5-methylcytosine-specific restriction protein A
MHLSEIPVSILTGTGYRFSMERVTPFRYRARPEQFPKREGFVIDISGSGGGAEFHLHTEDLAYETLLNASANASPQALDEFVGILQELGGIGEVSLEIGNSEIEIDAGSIQDSSWHNLAIKVRTTEPFQEEDPEFSQFAQGAIISLNDSLMCFFELAPTEIEDSELGLPEGAKQTVSVNKYERSSENRKACIDAFGTDCQICGFSFARKFEGIGEGYIHVHHLIPVSKMGGEYRINPIEDLIPVCPNCHAMLHKRDPPFTPQELREVMDSSKASR